MILSALKYIRHSDEPREWQIVGRNDDYAYFRNMNLLVGKNASGKSRTLNVIREIANLLAGKISLKGTTCSSEQFDIVFKKDEDYYRYRLSFANSLVQDEILNYNNDIIFDRRNNIQNNNKLDTDAIHQLDGHELMVSMVDFEGNPYFEDLFQWGHSLKNYLFANQLEKNLLVKDYTQIDENNHDIDEQGILIYTFYKGRKQFGDNFINEIISNMNELGYAISNIDILEKSCKYCLSIEESDQYIISQREISQGMFRALALFIMLSFARLSDLPFCLLIDDMGEGLDYDSSHKIIEIVTQKVENSNIQFFMTSNDRHVMNQIDLQYWSVIGRDKSKSIFYDYKNSKDIFDDFKYTGLNNFDFLSTNFFKEGFGTIDEDNN